MICIQCLTHWISWPGGRETLAPPFPEKENSGSERLSNFPKLIQLGSGGAGLDLNVLYCKASQFESCLLNSNP